MNKIILKQLLILLIAPVCLFSFTSKPDRLNFSGDWKLNESKSDLGQYANFATRSITTLQSNDSIAISRTSPSMDGEDITTHETLTFDGKECQTNLMGDSKKIASLKWADDGKTFTVTFKLHLDFNGQQIEIDGTEKWDMTDDGKTLVLETNSSSSFGDISTKSVFDKQ
ncbi:MAG: hypothetical protein JST17_09805 [Bacteroidetes bacterium]|nr:hypothetical protein [Bacteroidota bacterium]MBS1930001.1 hypothetical protein [Bacteroidota bacterium]